MLAKQIHAEKQLAIALGWSNLVEVGDTLLGTPPGGAENSRGQASVPKWARDWQACGPLIGAFKLSIDDASEDTGCIIVSISFSLNDYVQAFLADWPTADDALRYAITVGAVAKHTATARTA